MKTLQLLLSALILCFLFSCSDDDDSGQEPDLFEQERIMLQETADGINTVSDVYPGGIIH